MWDTRYVDALIVRFRATNKAGTFNENLFYTQDANYNVTALIDTSHVVQERYTYDPYGNPHIWASDFTTVRATSSFVNELMFAGYRRDAESALYNVRNRFYHPTLGSWLQRDPLRYEGGSMDLYEYVLSAPTRTTDPYGLDDNEAHIISRPIPGTRPNGEKDGFESDAKETMDKYAKDHPESNVIEVKDINDFNSQVRGVHCKCVKKLEIIGHANSHDDNAAQNIGTEYLPGAPKGSVPPLEVKKIEHTYWWDTYEYSGMEAFKDIKFCKPCTIVLRGCFVGKTSTGRKLMDKIKEVTGCDVQAFDDVVYGKPLDNGLPGKEGRSGAPNVATSGAAPGSK